MPLGIGLNLLITRRFGSLLDAVTDLWKALFWKNGFWKNGMWT